MRKKPETYLEEKPRHHLDIVDEVQEFFYKAVDGRTKFGRRYRGLVDGANIAAAQYLKDDEFRKRLNEAEKRKLRTMAKRSKEIIR